MEENKCSRCGNVHKNLPASYSADAPYFYEEFMSVFPRMLPEVQVPTFLSSDLCVVGNWFFIRGRIEIPIIDNGDKYIWDVWVSISREDYDRSLMLWENPEREHEGHTRDGWRQGFQVIKIQ